MMNDGVLQYQSIQPIKGMVRRARDLDVYRRAYPISLAIHQASLQFPAIEQYALADQLRRAAKSVCANIAEGFIRQRQSSKEFARFLLIAEASAEETCTWLQYAADLGYIPAKQFQDWDAEYIIIQSMLCNFRRSLK